MGIFSNGNGAAARTEERLSSALKAVDRLAAEHVRRADRHEQNLKSVETGLRADLQTMTAALARIEELLKVRNSNGAARAAAGAAVKKTAPPVGYATGGGALVYALQQLLSGG